MALPDESDLQKDLSEVMRLAGATLTPSDLVVEILPAPHRRPSSIPAGAQAVYAFFLLGRCLKVGKAGPKTQARFTSQHYGQSAPSTLAKSILKSPTRLVPVLPLEARDELGELDKATIGPWLERNTSRVHVFIPTGAGAFALNLAEAFIQMRCLPMFEGKTS